MGEHSGLRRRLTAVLFIFVVISFAFGTLTVVLYERRNQNLLYNAFHETLAAFSRSLERELASVERLTLDIMADDYVQEQMARLGSLKGGFSWHDISGDLKRRLLLFSRPPNVPAIVTVDVNGRTTMSRDDFPAFFSIFPRSEMEEFVDSEEAIRWVVTPRDDNRIFLLRRVREIEELSFKPLGTVVAILNKKELARDTAAAPFRENLELAVYHRGELVFAHGEHITESADTLSRPVPGEPQYTVTSVNGKSYFAATVSSRERPLQFSYMVPYDLLFESIEDFNTLLLIFSIVFALFLLIVSWWVARDVSKPIVQLASQMRLVEQKGFRGSVGDSIYRRSDEIGTLYREFDLMLERIETLINESYRTQIALKDVQFRSLQAQINPHFLYNTLESMNWIAQLNDQEELSTMVQALGKLLRASIDPRNTAISLEEEMELLRQYVSIQKVRYGERLQVIMELPQECAGYGIPKLTLQPLVENSIRYGLERFSHPCSIRVAAHLEGAKIVLEVADNGPGMERSFVDSLLQGEVEPKGSGVGVVNIYERLRRLYGESAGINIDSSPGKGTTVYLCVPAVGASTLVERIKKAHETETASYSR